MYLAPLTGEDSCSGLSNSAFGHSESAIPNLEGLAPRSWLKPIGRSNQQQPLHNQSYDFIHAVADVVKRRIVNLELPTIKGGLRGLRRFSHYDVLFLRIPEGSLVVSRRSP